jgi:hypothetical protein
VGSRGKAAVVLAALTAALAPLPAAWIDGAYTERWYVGLQSRVTPLSNLLPIAAFDLLLAGGALALLWSWTVGLRRAPAGRRSGTLARLAVNTVVAAAVVYLVFLATWGLNYRRVPLRERLDFRPDRVSSERLAGLTREAIEAVNVLYPALPSNLSELHELPSRLGPAFLDVQRLLPGPAGTAIGRPKPTVLRLYFRHAAVDGMTNPFLLEILVNADVLPYERPFVVAHEWAHLAGYADESEASFVGWLICLRGDVEAQYSGWLFLVPTLLRQLDEARRREMAGLLESGPRAHLQAIAARLRRSTPAVRRTAGRVYDQFLKAHRVEGGITSYEEVVTLVLGTRFQAGWVPAHAR